MPKQLKFSWEEQTVAFDMEKVDRTKLYGTKSLEVNDEHGERCRMVTLASDGRSLIEKGGTGLGQIDADGNWIEKSQMTPVDLAGQEITPVKSSFASDIELNNEVSTEEYLNHKIRLVYQLQTEAFPDSLKQRLTDGAIFKFDYSYRGGLEADAGFLIDNDEGKTFFLVGDPTDVTFKGLQEAAVMVDDEDLNEDEMDFGMI
jgi:hypothetical protein